MYRAHFGLKEKAFRVVPSPRFLFWSDTHDESQARILYGIREARGFVVVSGGIGLGKTTVMYSVLEKLEGETRTALVFNPVADFHQLLRMICMEFDVDTADADEVDLMYRLNRFLVERLAAGETCVLIIDEAQNLPLEVLEKVRTLSNLQTEESSLLQIVLVGQDELKEKLHDPRLVQLRQRIGVWHELRPLTAYETRSYVWHRLRLAGAAMPEALVIDSVCARMHELTGGIPRMINQLCETAFVIAYGRNGQVVSEQDVEEAARELHLLADAGVTDRSGEPDVGPMVEADVRPDVQAVAKAGGPSARRSGRRVPSPRREVSRLRPAAVIALLLLLIVAGFLSRPLWTDAVPADARAERETGLNLSPAPLEEPRAETFEASGAYRSACARGEALRAANSTVYAVHLGSFRSADDAKRFAQGLLEGSTNWIQPLYLEDAAPGSPWFRVLGGVFASRESALGWLRELRGLDGIGFARLDRLPRDAGVLEFSAAASEEEDLEQHT